MHRGGRRYTPPPSSFQINEPHCCRQERIDSSWKHLQELATHSLLWLSYFTTRPPHPRQEKAQQMRFEASQLHKWWPETSDLPKGGWGVGVLQQPSFRLAGSWRLETRGRDAVKERCSPQENQPLPLLSPLVAFHGLQLKIKRELHSPCSELSSACSQERPFKLQYGEKGPYSIRWGPRRSCHEGTKNLWSPLLTDGLDWRAKRRKNGKNRTDLKNPL